MTTTKFNELQDSSYNAFNHLLNYSEVCDLWDRAVYYNKLQNNFIKDDELNEVVKNVNLFCDESQNVKRFTVRAKKQWSRKQWFLFLTGEQLCSVSVEKLRDILNN